MSLLFDPTTGELVDETIVDSLPDSRKKAILSLLTPNLIFFSVNKETTLDNQDVTFSWKVTFAKKIKIIYLQNTQEIPAHGCLSLSLLRDAEVKLSYNGTKFESEIIKVKVYPSPVIQFEINNLSIENGDSVRILWNIKNFKRITLSGGVKDYEITEIGEIQEKPFSDTLYKLIITALDSATTIEKELIVKVYEKPKIIFFRAEPEFVLDCQPVTLSWNIQNAKRVIIDNGIGEVELIGEKKILPQKNSAFFTLTAYGEISNCSQEVFVRIFPTPVIDSLKIPMPDFNCAFSLSTIVLNIPNIDFQRHL